LLNCYRPSDNLNAELIQAAKSVKLYTYHFNMLRSILEKTAIFFGFNDFSACIQGINYANLCNCRQFYLKFPDQQNLYTLCRDLSWSHLRPIMRVDT
jgi:DUF1016 N-terminal domain